MDYGRMDSVNGNYTCLLYTSEALQTVPESYRSGALGMGATKWYMIRTILLPSAMPGIITGIIPVSYTHL